MKNIFGIILENLQIILCWLFITFMFFVSGQFGWAFIAGIVTGITTVVIIVLNWKDYKRRDNLRRIRKNDFKDWTRGK